MIKILTLNFFDFSNNYFRLGIAVVCPVFGSATIRPVAAVHQNAVNIFVGLLRGSKLALGQL